MMMDPQVSPILQMQHNLLPATCWRQGGREGGREGWRESATSVIRGPYHEECTVIVSVESCFWAVIWIGLLSSEAGDGLTKTRLAFPNTNWTAVLAVVFVTVVHDSFRTC